MGRCKRGCCWNPYGICARKHECHCHDDPTPGQKMQALFKEAAAMKEEETRWSR